jgi:nucleoside-diphosphate-sugar epimerase
MRHKSRSHESLLAGINWRWRGPSDRVSRIAAESCCGAGNAGDGGDRCYAPDAGRAIALLMTAATLRHNTYNVSSGRPATNREFADAL